MKPVINLMMDSGAYSAFTKGKIINLPEYCDFIIENNAHIATPVNLDSINPKDPDVAAAKGWDNYLFMKNRGIQAMPVFHAREKVFWLDKMLADTDYIGLSGTSLVSPSEHMAWYHLMWSYASDMQGRAVANFHAFGDTSPVSMRLFPWYSADSATWQIQSGKTGSVVIQGKPYKLRSKTITDSKFLSDDDPEPKRKVWQDELRRRGINVDLLMKEALGPVELTCIRCLLNASNLLDLKETTKNVIRYTASPALVDTNRAANVGHDREGAVKMFFVVSTAVCPWALPVLAKLGIKDILLSYHYCEKKFWYKTFVPYLYDPVGTCLAEPKLRRFWDILEKFSVKEVVV